MTEASRAASAPASDSVEFALDPALPIAALATRFAASGRMQIDDFLAAAPAKRLRTYLEYANHWRHHLNSHERSYEILGSEWEAMPEAERCKLAGAIDAAAAYDFQYQYDAIRVPDDAGERARASTPLDRFARFLSSPPVLATLMHITGATDLVYADCQATRYRTGDFLTPHSDEVDGMHRRFAYVLNLTPEWMPRWGGLLHFVDQRGGVEATITPRFNALSLFAVGQSHYVSQVATFAPLPRISVTGWLRTQAPA